MRLRSASVKLWTAFEAYKRDYPDLADQGYRLLQRDLATAGTRSCANSSRIPKAWRPAMRRVTS